MQETASIDEVRLVRSRDAARFLDYSERQLRRLVETGVLQAVKVTPNGHPRYRIRDLVALAEEGRK